jgi:hypothetical protein
MKLLTKLESSSLKFRLRQGVRSVNDFRPVTDEEATNLWRRYFTKYGLTPYDWESLAIHIQMKWPNDYKGDFISDYVDAVMEKAS